jgi:hypothetical protein
MTLETCEFFVFPKGELMKSIRIQALVVCLSGMLAAPPALGSSPQELVGVAQGVEIIQINGYPFGG